MRFGLDETTITKIKDTFIKFPEIEKVLIYGSRAKGTQKNGSDIDLTLIGSAVDLTIRNKLANQLDDLNLPYMFDISIFSQISNVDFIDHIKRIGVEFYRK